MARSRASSQRPLKANSAVDAPMGDNMTASENTGFALTKIKKIPPLQLPLKGREDVWCMVYSVQCMVEG